MSTPTRTPSMESSGDNNIRKRVCKACDRCRLKKSKCDGSSPCSRCKADNAICVFGERKKAHDKVYPKGYVEMLEQQQSQLVAGMRELYSRLIHGQGWPGAPLQESQGGHPLTHDILERLDLLHATGDSNESYGAFEENTALMQQRLVERGAKHTTRRGSVSSESDHGHTSSPSSHGTPPTRPLSFHEHAFTRSNMAPPTPTQSPFPQPSQLHHVKTEPPPAFTQSPLARTGGLDPQAIMRNSWATETPMMEDGMMDYLNQFDAPMTYDIQQQLAFEQYSMAQNPTFPVMDWSDPNDLEFNTFINPVST